MASDMYNDATERGKITWHCSEEDSGPDVGLSLGLGNGILWVGEISKNLWWDTGEDGRELSKDNCGWWLVRFDPDATVLGKFLNAETARDFIEKMAVTMREKESVA